MAQSLYQQDCHRGAHSKRHRCVCFVPQKGKLKKMFAAIQVSTTVGLPKDWQTTAEVHDGEVNSFSNHFFLFLENELIRSLSRWTIHSSTPTRSMLMRNFANMHPIRITTLRNFSNFFSVTKIWHLHQFAPKNFLFLGCERAHGIPGW